MQALFLFLGFLIASPAAHAVRWEFSCRSLDGKIAFNRTYLNLVDKDLSGKDRVRAFRNMNINNDPAYADERSPLVFVENSKTLRGKYSALHLVNMKPGKEAIAKLSLNQKDKFCARNGRAYTTTFRMHRNQQASFVPFHCEEALIYLRSDADRCLWQPKLVPALP